MIKIDGARLLRDLKDLAAIGAYKTGVHRPSLSADDVRARKWLVERMREAGLDAGLDGISNVIGRSPQKRALLIGSHMETQPRSGWLDGTMGVLYGLEIARSLPKDSKVGIDVGAWFDEEMWYGYMLGSRSFCGSVEDEEIDAAKNRETGNLLRDDLHAAGLSDVPRATLDVERNPIYLEAHIEQGSRLEADDHQIGVVTAIVGGRNYIIRAFGEQNHAGATRMALHRDAGLALCRLRVALAEHFPEMASPATVWTSGFMNFNPGISTVIPGEAEMQFQFRDTDSELLERLDAKLRELANAVAGPCRIEIETVRSWSAYPMSPDLQDIFEAAAEVHAPGRHTRMHSAAGHDAQNFTLRVPTGMIFVPSIGGISHHWTEDTKEEDIVAGCRVFASGIEQILSSLDQ